MNNSQLAIKNFNFSSQFAFHSSVMSDHPLGRDYSKTSAADGDANLVLLFLLSRWGCTVAPRELAASVNRIVSTKLWLTSPKKFQ